VFSTKLIDFEKERKSEFDVSFAKEAFLAF